MQKYIVKDSTQKPVSCHISLREYNRQNDEIDSLSLKITSVSNSTQQLPIANKNKISRAITYVNHALQKLWVTDSNARISRHVKNRENEIDEIISYGKDFRMQMESLDTLYDEKPVGNKWQGSVLKRCLIGAGLLSGGGALGAIGYKYYQENNTPYGGISENSLHPYLPPSSYEHNAGWLEESFGNHLLPNHDYKYHDRRGRRHLDNYDMINPSNMARNSDRGFLTNNQTYRGAISNNLYNSMRPSGEYAFSKESLAIINEFEFGFLPKIYKHNMIKPHKERYEVFYEAKLIHTENSKEVAPTYILIEIANKVLNVCYDGACDKYYVCIKHHYKVDKSLALEVFSCAGQWLFIQDTPSPMSQRLTDIVKKSKFIIPSYFGSVKGIDDNGLFVSKLDKLYIRMEQYFFEVIKSEARNVYFISGWNGNKINIIFNGDYFEYFDDFKHIGHHSSLDQNITEKFINLFSSSSTENPSVTLTETGKMVTIGAGAGVVGAGAAGTGAAGAGAVGAGVVGARIVGARIVGTGVAGTEAAGAGVAGAGVAGAGVAGAGVAGAGVAGAGVAGAGAAGAGAAGAGAAGAGAAGAGAAGAGVAGAGENILTFSKNIQGLINVEIITQVNRLNRSLIQIGDYINAILNKERLAFQNIIGRPGTSVMARENDLLLEYQQRRLAVIEDLAKYLRESISTLEGIVNQMEDIQKNMDRNLLKQVYGEAFQLANLISEKIKNFERWYDGELIIANPVQLSSSQIPLNQVTLDSENLASSAASDISNIINDYLDMLESPVTEELNYPESMQRALQSPINLENLENLIRYEIERSPSLDNYYFTELGSSAFNELIKQNIDSIVPYVEGDITNAGPFTANDGTKWFGIKGGKFSIKSENSRSMNILMGDRTVRLKLFHGRYNLIDFDNLSWLGERMANRNLAALTIRNQKDLASFVIDGNNQLAGNVVKQPSRIFVHPAKENIISPTPFLTDGTVDAVRRYNVKILSGNEINGPLTLVNYNGRVKDSAGIEYITYSENKYIRILNATYKNTYRIGQDFKHSILIGEFSDKYAFIPMHRTK